MTGPAVGLSVSQTMVACATGWPWGCFNLVLLLSVAFYLLFSRGPCLFLSLKFALIIYLSIHT
jgi:hypothetical protein